jgi:hypothetical protein
MRTSALALSLTLTAATKVVPAISLIEIHPGSVATYDDSFDIESAHSTSSDDSDDFIEVKPRISVSPTEESENLVVARFIPFNIETVEVLSDILGTAVSEESLRGGLTHEDRGGSRCGPDMKIMGFGALSLILVFIVVLSLRLSGKAI